MAMRKHPWVLLQSNTPLGRYVCAVFNESGTVQGRYQPTQQGGCRMAEDFYDLGFVETFLDLGNLRGCLKRDMTGDELEWFVSGFQMGRGLWPVE